MFLPNLKIQNEFTILALTATHLCEENPSLCSTLEPLYYSSHATAVGEIQFINFVDSGTLLAHGSMVDCHFFFYQQAFIESMGGVIATTTQANAARRQGGASNLQRFKAHHPPTFIGETDQMVAGHWFCQIERIL